MKRIRILFIGASRLVGLLERFRTAATSEDLELDIVSFEDDAPWHAIAAAGLCRIERAGRFDDPGFGRQLVKFVGGQSVDIVIPVIDAATLAVSRTRPDIESTGATVLLSRGELCEGMRDKRLADRFFRDHGLPVPDGDVWPRVAKPRLGASSRGLTVLHDPEELAFWMARNREEDFLIQPFLTGEEHSVDAYVGPDGRVLGSVSRVREVVSGGEVMVTRTAKNDGVLSVADRVLSIPGWYGPINIQILDAAGGPMLIEINPRFAGGVTCAIEAGLDSPRWILRERLGRSLPEGRVEWRPGLCMTRSRRDHFLWLS